MADNKIAKPTEENAGTTPNDDSATQPNPAQVEDSSTADTQIDSSPADNQAGVDEVSEPIPEPELEAEFAGEGAEVKIAQPEKPEPSEESEISESSDKSEKLENSDSADSDIAEEAADSEQSESQNNQDSDSSDNSEAPIAPTNDDPNAKWYVVHTFSGHENKVATNLKQRIDSEHLENKILDILVPTQDKIEIKGGKKGTVKEKIFPGYILVKMVLDDQAWLAVRTTQGVTAFVGMNNKPTPISEREVQSIVKFMTQGAPATFKDVFLVDDTVKIIDGPFTDFIGKVESVDKEKGKVRVLVSIFGRETPVELDFLQVTKL